MEALGINFGLLIVQSIIPITWFVFTGVCLVDLARKKLTGTPLALWVLIICAIPLLGALAYCIVKPADESLKKYRYVRRFDAEDGDESLLN